MSTNCRELGSTSHVACQNQYFYGLGMFDDVRDKGTMRMAMFGAVFIPVLMFYTVSSNLLLIRILHQVKSPGCVHCEFGITLCLFIILSSIVQNLMTTYLVRSMPWMQAASLDITTLVSFDSGTRNENASLTVNHT